MAKSNSEYQALLQEYRKLAKKADQRLVRLEKLSTEENFEQVKQWAYKRAVKDAMLWGAKESKPRFNIKPPTNITSLRAKIQDIKVFLEAPTSTKAGVMNIYVKKANTINDKYGTSLNWSDVAVLFESRIYKKLNSKFGSATALRAIGLFQENEAQILKEFEQSKASHVRTEDNDMIINEAIKTATRYYKKDVKKLLNQLD